MAAGNLAVEFTMTENDYVAFCRYHATQSRSGKRTVWRGRIILGLAAIAVATFAGMDPQLPPGWHGLPMLPITLVIALIPAALIGFGYPFLLRSCVGWNTRRRLRDATFHSVLQRQRLELSAEGLKWSGAAGESTTRWSAFSDVVEDAQAAYAYMTSVQAYIIPRRAFADGAAFERFVATIRRSCKTAPAST